MPSEELNEKVQQFETIFKVFHGKELNMTHDPVKKLTDIILKKYPNTPRDVVSLFSKTRMFIRLKYLNDILKEKEKSLKKRYAAHVNKF